MVEDKLIHDGHVNWFWVDAIYFIENQVVYYWDIELSMQKMIKELPVKKDKNLVKFKFRSKAQTHLLMGFRNTAFEKLEG